MRDFLVLLIVIGSVPVTLVQPVIGIYMWFWISLMNPHRLTWGYAYQFRVALVVAGATLVAWLFSRLPKWPPSSPPVYMLALFTFWVSLSTEFAIMADDAFIKWQEIIKILAMTFVTTCVIRTPERIQRLVWVIAVSLGFYGIRGGIFSVMTGGNFRIYGPEGTFIGDNNQLALSLIMIVPLLQYLRLHSSNRWIRLGLLGSIGLTMISILCSYSRGALIALVSTLFLLWLKTKNRAITALVTGVVLIGALAWLPSAWYDRMNTIGTYQKDASAVGRLDAWTFAYKIALDHPILGAGLEIVNNQALYFSYVPSAEHAQNFHSIYFQVLGEFGFVGLAIFLGMILSTLMTARWIIRQARARPDLEWAGSLAAMIQVSIIGYCLAGAFLNLGFYDLYYALLAVLVATRCVVAQELGKAAPEASPAKGYPVAPALQLAGAAQHSVA